MLEQLLTEQRNPASANIDELPTLDMLRVINQEDRRCAEAVEAALSAITEAVERVTEVLRAGHQLFYIGAGTSGRLGILDASEWAPTFNVSPDTCIGVIAGGHAAVIRPTEASEDDPQRGVEDLLAAGFTPDSALIGIASSGRTPYVLGAVRYAREQGAFTAGISCTPNSLLSQAVECPIELLVGPEVLTGSTRMKSGTATKMALNMISTGAMIRLGFVYSNLMVNVQPKNEKLVDRALRIIMTATGVDRETASRVLEQSERNVRVAIVMAKLGVDRTTALVKLEDARGSIAAALNL